MPNPENLKPLNTIGKEEAKKIRQKGQKAQKEAQRAKKTLKESYEVLLDAFLEISKKKIVASNELSQKEKDNYLSMLVNCENILAFEQFQIAFSRGIKKETKLKAIEDIQNRLYGKSKQLIGSDPENPLPSCQVIVLTETEKENYLKEIEKIEE